MQSTINKCTLLQGTAVKPVQTPELVSLEHIYQLPYLGLGARQDVSIVGAGVKNVKIF